MSRNSSLEDVVLQLHPVLVLGVDTAVSLNAQELLLVVPLVQRLGLVESLIALQPDEARPAHRGHRLGQLGLAGTGRPFDEDRLSEALGQVDHAGDAIVGEVLDLRQAFADTREVSKHCLAHSGCLRGKVVE